MSLLSSLTNRVFVASASLVVVALGLAIYRVGVTVAAQAETDLRVGLAEAASLVEPLACCFNAWKDAEVTPEDRVLVLGTGPIAALFLMLSRAYGVRQAIVVGRRASRLGEIAPYGATETVDGPFVLHPPKGGVVCRVVEFEPEDPEVLKTLDGMAAFAEMGAAHAIVENARHPFMHRTDSVDYAIILRGEITMLLDDSEVHLKAGDVLVQRGTNHAWSNRGTETCLIAFVLVDAVAKHDKSSG